MATPQELDLIHLRLQQIGMALGELGRLTGLTHPEVWQAIKEIEQGLDGYTRGPR